MKKEHTVEFMSMDYFMKSEAMKKRSDKMAEMGMPSCSGPFKTSEEAQESEKMKREMYKY